LDLFEFCQAEYWLVMNDTIDFYREIQSGKVKVQFRLNYINRVASKGKAIKLPDQLLFDLFFKS
jgi:hypothetical protein